MNKLSAIMLIIFSLTILSYAISASVRYNAVIKGSGKAIATVTDVSTEKHKSSTGHSYFSNRATVIYKVNGEEYTSSLRIGNSGYKFAGDKITVYYDKNSPSQLINEPSGLNSLYILSSFMLLAGIGVLVLKRDE